MRKVVAHVRPTARQFRWPSHCPTAEAVYPQPTQTTVDHVPERRSAAPIPRSGIRIKTGSSVASEEQGADDGRRITGPRPDTHRPSSPTYRAFDGHPASLRRGPARRSVRTQRRWVPPLFQGRCSASPGDQTDEIREFSPTRLRRRADRDSQEREPLQPSPRIVRAQPTGLVRHDRARIGLTIEQSALRFSCTARQCGQWTQV